MTRVLMLVSNGFTHDPRVSAEATSLTKAGYEVTVIAWDRKRILPRDERRDGVRVVRVRNTLSMRLRGYDLFRLKPFWRLAARCALELHAATPFHAIHCHDLDTLPAGVRFKVRTNVRLIYHAHEVFPSLLEASRAPRWAPRFEAMERRLMPHADLVIAAGPGHCDYLGSMTNVRIAIVTNSKPLASGGDAPPRAPRGIGGGRRFVRRGNRRRRPPRGADSEFGGEVPGEPPVSGPPPDGRGSPPDARMRRRLLRVRPRISPEPDRGPEQVLRGPRRGPPDPREPRHVGGLGGRGGAMRARD